jgi:hypothetical protein
LAHGALDEVEGLVTEQRSFQQIFHLGPQAALLEGLTALRDRERTEAEAEPLLKAGMYLEPFASRALGIVREDDELVRKAIGLHWYAEETLGR